MHGRLRHELDPEFHQRRLSGALPAVRRGRHQFYWINTLARSEYLQKNASLVGDFQAVCSKA
ncbi:MAG: hypothetical protein WDO24_11255 [Pseudomonadota bacterium]